MNSPLTIEQYLQAIAPNLLADASASIYITMAKERTNAKFYGHKYNQAVALLAAHIAFLFTPQAGAMGPGSGNAEAGTTGTIVSKKEGDLSISYGSSGTSGISASTNASDAELAQTRFGLQLLALRKGCKPFMGVVRGC